nr:ATP synthase F0 subunit 8 [Laeocathaica amdoana]WBF92701.1 ATP synthase F0 subunit 8 [Laeocathaica amdoana]
MPQLAPHNLILLVIALHSMYLLINVFYSYGSYLPNNKKSTPYKTSKIYL